MSDNGAAIASRVFAAELERVGARQILTPPYTPRWNGKVERFFQTLQAGMGLRPLLAELGTSAAGPAILSSLLQPAQAPQLTWRPAADQPRSQRPWAGQLAQREAISPTILPPRLCESKPALAD